MSPEELRERFERHKAMTLDLVQIFTKHFEESDKTKALEFTKAAVVTMTSVAAMYAVDSWMTREQFLNVCAANFDQSYAAAPKFG